MKTAAIATHMYVDDPDVPGTSVAAMSQRQVAP